MSEGIREFTRKTLEHEKKTPFTGYIFFINSLPGCRLNFELWDEEFGSGHYSEFCRCDRVSALEMLDVHTLFERSFRLLHFWDNQLAHLDTHLYLINQLLQDLDTKRDPSIGFFFVLVDEEPEEDDDAYLLFPYRQFFSCHAENEEEIRRSGLFMGLLPPKENSFFTEDFHLESISVCCRVTCRGLVYIALNDLREFIEPMAKSMRCWNEGWPHPIEEDEERERNWMKRKIANFWIKLKKELIPIKPYQMSVFQEDSPFRPFFKPVEKKRQINESTECLELLFGNG
ncbi:unnamed protein product, partial [Mesorhabditis belari]|uniref:Uncharacterized protein n=1 Tax=Mesorhabditis belari TaxID=2138241 RepID=A0AAF3EJP9_9BILA